MIDTDKYEGHTPAPWDSLVCATTGKKWIIDGPEETGQTIALVEGIGENDVGWINMWLMADAPLLLEEVLRLQRELDTQYEYIEWLEEFAPKAGDYNTAWDAYELAKGIHWTQKEEEE